jgi:RsiW-degrading membrane proteinase PrsW (M82 family)
MRVHKGFTIKELIVLIILIALFVVGFKFGSRFVSELLIDYKNEFWFVWLVLIGGIISGILPVSVFIFSSFCIGMFVLWIKEKRNKNKRIDA